MDTKGYSCWVTVRRNRRPFRHQTRPTHLATMDDAAWLAAVPWMEGPQSIDEILEELLLEDYGAVKREVQPHLVATGSGGVPPRASKRAVSTDRDASSERPKRKRVRTARPSERIAELRELVRTMSDQVTLLRSRKRQKPHAPQSCEEKAIDKARSRLWMNVAMRQHQYLCESQRESAKLRAQAVAHMNTIRSMARLLRRACTGRQPGSVPRPLQPAEVAFLSQKRQHFFETANAVCRQAVAFLAKVGQDPISPDRVEQRLVTDATTNTPFLGDTLVLHLVPHPFSQLCNELWAFDQNATLPSYLYSSSTLEKTPDTELSAVSVTFDTPVGRADYIGLGLRCRVQEPSREIIVTIGALWATPSTPPPFDGVNFELRTWSVVQPLLGSPGDVNEVMTKVETWKVPSPFASGQVDISSEQAKTLHRIVERQHDYHLSGLRRHLDAIMMGGLATSPQ